MEQLKITEQDYSPGIKTMKVSGLADGELYKLRHMGNEDARKQLLDWIDERNGGLAQMWHNEHGILGIWLDNEAAYVNIGNNSD